MSRKARSRNGFRQTKTNTQARFREYFGLDVRSLCLFRIFIASILLFDLGLRSTDLVAFYTDAGVLPRHTLAKIASHWTFSVHTLSGDPYFETFLFMGHAIAAFLLLIGYHTKLTTAICWVLLTSLHARNPIILNGGDTYLRMLLFWSIFLPLEAVWSVDTRRRTKRGAAGTSEPGNILADGTATIYSLASIAFVVQVMLVYFCSGAAKAAVTSWQDGRAVEIALSMEHLVTPIGSELLRLPSLLKVLTYATLMLEIAGPIVLLLSTGWLRVAIILPFVVFHAGLAICFNIGLFPVVCIAALMAMIPSNTWYWNKSSTTCRPATAKSRPRQFGTIQVARIYRLSEAAAIAIQAIALTVTVWSSLGTINESWELPRPLRTLGTVFKWNQSWRMFVSISGTKPQGWTVVHGQLRDGTSVNLLTGDTPVSYDKPTRIAQAYSGARWRKLYSNIRQRRYRDVRTTLGRYLRRQWQSDELTRLRIYYVRLQSTVSEEPDLVTVFGEPYSVKEHITMTRLYAWKRPD